jgi:predicted molibdopterin-dependent oxidoreductase YjgC
MTNEKTMRIDNAGRAATIGFFFDGQAASARSGESVAAALFASGTKTLRTSPRDGSPRGMFCLMGSCQECLVMVDGRRVLACRTTVADGMRVEKVPEVGIDA